MLLYTCPSLGTTWCIVSYSFLLLSLLILFLTILQYYRIYKHTFNIALSLKLVFIVQASEALIMTIHYLFINADIDFLFLLQEYFISIQYSTVFYYFVSQLIDAFKALQGLPKIKVPLIILNAVMLLGFIVFVSIYFALNYNLYTCESFIWIYLHGCNFLLSVGFMIFGVIASRLLKVLITDRNIIVDNEKFKQFWYMIYRIVIICMCIASLVNIAETIWYIGQENSNCYDTYVKGIVGNVLIFCLIRILSHYIFIFACLVIFRLQRITMQSLLVSESDRGDLGLSKYADDSFNEFNILTSRVNLSSNFKK